jgi:hypothetical protein
MLKKDINTSIENSKDKVIKDKWALKYHLILSRMVK